MSMSEQVELVEELQNRLNDDPELAAAFAALTPGRQRGYNFHVAKAKQAATRERRIDSCRPKILAGLGLQDRDPATPRKPLKPQADGTVLLSGGNPQIAKGDGPEPVEAYLAAIPGWKQGIGRHLDGLIVDVVPDVRKAVRWNSPFYGVEGLGWFASYHCFDRYVKVTFLNGARLDPPPPVDGKDPDARYHHIHQGDDIDDGVYRSWLQQASTIPAWDGF
jgi:hypothetical protein